MNFTVTIDKSAGFDRVSLVMAGDWEFVLSEEEARKLHADLGAVLTQIAPVVDPSGPETR